MLLLLNHLVYTGTVVSQSEPMEKEGLYWGYSVRVAQKFEDIDEQCPYDEGRYDLKIGVTDDSRDG